MRTTIRATPRVTPETMAAVFRESVSKQRASSGEKRVNRKKKRTDHVQHKRT
jgi:hypothetical protein